MKTRTMKNRIHLLGLLCAALVLLSLGGCSRNVLTGSKLTSANYDWQEYFNRAQAPS